MDGAEPSLDVQETSKRVGAVRAAGTAINRFYLTYSIWKDPRSLQYIVPILGAGTLQSPRVADAT
jgi:hypothetical protein